jgi:hypothetical protein
MWQYFGQLAKGLDWYSNSWAIEMSGPQPTFAQISLSVVGIPDGVGFAASYITSYFKKDPSDPSPVFIDLFDVANPYWTYVTMAANPTMTSLTFTVGGSVEVAANVNVAATPVPVYPPYGVPPP